MVTEVQAINSYTHANVFIAGSISYGRAEEWQVRFVRKMKERFDSNKELDLVILNPRRRYLPSEPSELENQIQWELDGLASSDFIAMYFDPKTISPITLLELGLFATEKIFVCCTPEYYRYQNIKVVAKNTGIPLFHSEEEWMETIFKNIEGFYNV